MAPMNLSQATLNELCLAIISIFNLGLGLFVLIKQPKRIVNRAFATIAAGIFVWGTSIFLLSNTRIFGWNTLIMYGFAILLYGLVIFASVFPEKTDLPWRRIALAFVPLFAIIILAPMGLIVRNGIFHPGSAPEPVNGPCFFVLVVLSAAYVGTSIWLFIRTFLRSRGREREQMRYFLLGLTVFVLCAFLFDIFLPAIHIYQLNFLGPISSIILTGATAYAIVRHDLLDVRVVIQRGIIYTILFAIILGAYSAGVELLGDLIHNLTETSVVIWGGVATVIGAFLVGPIERYFRKVTDAIFFKDTYDYADALHTLSRIPQTSLNRAEIITRSSENLRTIFKTENVEFIFDSSASAVSSARTVVGSATLSIPIVFETDVIGTLALGAKRSGDSYTKRDVKLLSTFAIHAAVAIAKADLHAQVEGHNAHLETVVEERTREIKKLQEDQKQIMIDISHNLQTPLAIVRNELEALDESTVDESSVSNAKDSVDRVSGFIRQLLHLARLEHSLYDVDLRDLDLSQLVQEQVDYFEIMAAESGVRIEADIRINCHILGNKRLLQELFINLVTNAMTYRSPKRELVIRISLSCKDHRVEVSVADNGIGIESKNLPELFTRFYRVPQVDTKTVKEGTGLGLAIVKNIVERHGGTIRVESEIDAGTTFFFELPCGMNRR